MRIATRGRLLLSAALCVAAAQAQLEPARSATDYTHHCEIGDHQIGVEYLSRQLPTPAGSFWVPDALIFEVGVFPAVEQTLEIDSANLELVVNQGSYGRTPVDGTFVAASLRHPEWVDESKPRLVGVAATGGGAVIFGSPQPGRRFPDDPRAESDYPRPLPDAGRQSRDRMSTDDLAYILTSRALPRHSLDRPTAGYVYFRHTKRLKRLKKLELRVHLDDGDCSLKLDPGAISDSADPKLLERPSTEAPDSQDSPFQDPSVAAPYARRL